MRMSIHLYENKVTTYRSLVEKFYDVFAQPYDKLKGIPL